MTGLVFEVQAPIIASAPNRADIALFVGFVKRRPEVSLPAPIRAWLTENGWTLAPDGLARMEALLDVPTPIEGWDVFDRLFEWERRPISDAGTTATTYLGAAVRSFFAQGGRKCYVVRLGEPWALTAERATRLANRPLLLPDYPAEMQVSPADQATWHGIAHLYGLPDVSFLCLPDLADMVSVNPRPPATSQPTTPEGDEQFVECSAPAPTPPPDGLARLWPAPRCDDAGYAAWADVVRRVGQFISGRLKEVQFVAALPIPEAGSVAEQGLLVYLTERNPWLVTGLGSPTGLASAFIQLVYPWTRTPGADNLPEALESPDAVLVGGLARNALARGTYRSAAGQPLADVYDVAPLLRRDEMLKPSPRSRPLIERVSLLGPTPQGWRLLSDVTTARDENYRPAHINRLVSAIVRAARRLGEDVLFEASGERLWASLTNRLTDFLTGLLVEGALRGPNVAEAFAVRCDRTTMTQNDVDNGRVVASITFVPAAAVEEIRVVLAVKDGVVQYA